MREAWIVNKKNFKNHIAETPEARESQLISLAFDLAERKIREGTASSQVMTHFLKLGTIHAELEKEKLVHENELLRAKTEAIKSQQRMDEMYANALAAMRSYSGKDEDSDEVEDEYDDYGY